MPAANGIIGERVAPVGQDLIVVNDGSVDAEAPVVDCLDVVGGLIDGTAPSAAAASAATAIVGTETVGTAAAAAANTAATTAGSGFEHMWVKANLTNEAFLTAAAVVSA